MTLFQELLKVPLPTSSVKVGKHYLDLQALSSNALDDLITKHPSENKDTNDFGPDFRFELVALTITNLQLSIEDVKQLFDAWSRPDVMRVQEAVFKVNWSGEEEALVPLSANGSDKTGSTPSN